MHVQKCIGINNFIWNISISLLSFHANFIWASFQMFNKSNNSAFGEAIGELMNRCSKHLVVLNKSVLYCCYWNTGSVTTLKLTLERSQIKTCFEMVQNVICVYWIQEQLVFRNLPAKSVEEALRHRQEYDEMVAEAKKRGMLTASNHYNSF